MIMTSSPQKHVRQKRRSKHSRRPALRITVGNMSMMDVITTSMPTNCTGTGWDKYISKCEFVFLPRVHPESTLLVCPDPRGWAWQRNRWTTVGEEASWLQPEGTQWTPSLDLEHNNIDRLLSAFVAWLIKHQWFCKVKITSIHTVVPQEILSFK